MYHYSHGIVSEVFQGCIGAHTNTPNLCGLFGTKMVPSGDCIFSRAVRD